MNKYCKALLIACCGIALPSLSFAQDAGELLQLQEQNLSPELPKEEKDTLEPLPAEIKTLEGLLITIEHFEFVGNTLVASNELLAATSAYLNREITFTDLQKVAAAAADVYRNKGLLVRVYMPQQEIRNGGSVQFRIVEARFGKVQLGDIDPSFSKVKNLEKWITTPQPIGEAVKPADVDRGLLILNDLSGVSATGNLTRGESESETDFLLSITRTKNYQGNVSASNDGSLSTGSEKLNGAIQFNNPMMFGDQIATSISLSEGSDYARLAYSFPLFYSGLKISTAVSHMQYEVIEGLVSLKPEGASDTFQVSARYPIIRHKKRNLYFTGAYNVKDFENKILGNVTSDYEVSGLFTELSGNMFDKYLGGGMFQSSLSFTKGETDLAGSPNKASDASTVDTQGGFDKWEFSIERRQNIVEDVSLTLKHKMQFASKNLDSSERFSIGGSGTVRAYPSGEASGSEGSLSQLELNWKAKDSVLLTAFYDYGKITINKDTGFLLTASKNEYALKGAGFAARVNAPNNFSGQLTYARRIGDNPNANFDGSDKDGTLKENRFWLSVNWMF